MQFNKSDLPKIKECADYIRYLSLMSVEYANSGHPGLPLGCAEIGTILYNYFLKINPEMPGWINRDRFILSAGHGSMFLYSLLYLAGYKFTLQDLADFRQMGSITPGHPEYNIDMGIETTTGPLGQGFANAVGLAIKGKMLAARFNKPGFDIFNYRVFTLMGDGCNMEGLSSEAASIAGHLGLDNLIAIYDSNNITIDGSTDITFTENVALRYEAQGWQTAVCDISDIEDFYQKLAALSAVSGKPKLLVVKTIIGQGLDKSRGSHEIHGAPAGVSEIAYFIQNSCMKKIYGKEYPDEINDREKLSAILGKLVKEKAPLKDNTSVTDFFQQAMKKNSQSYHAWTELFSAYSSKFPKEHDQLLNSMSFSIPERLAKDLINFKVDKADATRNIAGKILELCCAQIPQIIGGSADLVGSTRATVKGSVYINKNDFSGRNIAFGVRENAMGSIGNGLSLGGMLIPFTSTFFTFFDYMKPAVRLAALMKLKHLFIFTHDSIYVGEDGPTHQPVEHLNSLRLIPDLLTFRPGNAMETAFSFLYFFENMEGPAVILGSRQKLDQAVFNLTGDRGVFYENFKKGAYIVYETERTTKPDIIFAGSGSELSLALESAKIIETQDKRNVRVVSIPCLELFHKAGDEYKTLLLGDRFTPMVFTEAASHRALKLFYRKNMMIADIEDFGLSGPAHLVGKRFGFTPDAIAENARQLLKET